MGLSQFDESWPFIQVVNLTNATGTTTADVVSTQNRVIRLDQLLVATDNATDVQMNFFLKFTGTATYFTGHMLVAGTGVGGTLAPDLVPILWPSSSGALILPVGWSLVVAVQAALGSGKNLFLTAIGGFV